MKTYIFTLLSLGFSTMLQAQSIIGSWQLVRETNCVEEHITADNENVQNLTNDMKAMSSPTPQVVTFKEKAQGEESTRILTRKKPSNKKSFLYRFDGERLMILDKRSQTITENFTVEQFSADSLIVSSASRPCETKVFVRLE